MEIINILDKLKEKYEGKLKDNIISISIIQTRYTISMDVTSVEILEDGLKKTYKETINLNMITEDKHGKFIFNQLDSIEVNVGKIINETSPNIIMYLEKAFNKEYSSKFKEERKFILA